MFDTNDKNVTENRRMFVGGSDVPIIFGISKYKKAFELAKEKVGLAPVVHEPNEYTLYGQLLEPQIRDYINAINETNFQPESIVNKELRIRGNCDGVDYGEQLLLEIKTHGKHPTMDVYKLQIQTYLYVFDLPACWLALYKREDTTDTAFDSESLNIEVIHRDDEQINAILEQIDVFWKRCEALKANPEMSEVEFYSIGFEDEYELATLAGQVQKLEAQLASFKEIEKKAKEAKEKLYELMMAHKVKSFEAGKYQITSVLPTTSTKEEVDINALKEAHPRIAKKFISEKTTNRKGHIKVTEKKEAKA